MIKIILVMSANKNNPIKKFTDGLLANKSLVLTEISLYQWPFLPDLLQA